MESWRNVALGGVLSLEINTDRDELLPALPEGKVYKKQKQTKKNS